MCAVATPKRRLASSRSPLPRATLSCSSSLRDLVATRSSLDEATCDRGCASPSRCRGRRSRACRWRPVALAQQLRVAVLLLARATPQLRDEIAPDQRGQRLVHLIQSRKGVNALATLLELAWGLRAAQHQHAHDSLLGA